jgi:LmbE family N-acetylglucosaminyl deacetylase
MPGGCTCMIIRQMKRLATAEDMRTLGAILFVGAHPDDEIWTAGGIMAVAARSGQRVGCVNATRGEWGVQDEARWPQARLAQIRARELEESLAVLGVREHWWLDYEDGKCGEADEAEAAAQVRGIVEAFRPDTILTFGPDGYTGHPDHRAMCRWTKRAVQGLDRRARVLWVAVEAGQYEELREADEAAQIFFTGVEPVLVRSDECVIDFRLPADLIELKRRAFEAVPSQTGKLMAARPFAVPGRGLARECFVAAA